MREQSTVERAERAPVGVAAALLLVGLVAGPVGAADAPIPLVFEFSRYNDTYTGLETEVQPIARGPLTVRLSSPRYDLVVYANRLELAPAGECRHRGALSGRFAGEGDLVADVELGSFPARFEDRVRILEQEKEIEAEVTIETLPSGYRVTLERLPETATVAIESDLATGLVSFCRRLSLFVPGEAGCDVLDRLLANPRLPLPEPGTRFVVRRDELLAEERQRLEDYLAAEPDCPRLATGGASGSG